MRTTNAALHVVAIAMWVWASPVLAQTSARPASRPQTVTVPAGDDYDRGGFWRALFGDGWRDVWSAEITVPVLDLDAYAGGLEPFKAGGNQSRTLRMHGADGRTYIFRSTEKDIEKTLPDDLKNTPISAIAQDQGASFHPSGALVVAVLQDAVGLLHTPPTLVFMPDHPRLGEFREDFANTLGQIEERPDESDQGPTFANADKISGADKLLEKVEESMEDRLDSRDYLKARLIDFIVGDTDRGADQWRFAKFEDGKNDVYRSIPRDRDYAFMQVEGLLMGLAKKVHPRLVRFDENYPGLQSLVYMTQEFDRGQLVDLTWEEWDAVTKFTQQRITNQVIDEAVVAIPEAQREKSGDDIAAALRVRRDMLPAIAHEFYLLVNEEPEIFASDEAERADIERHADGSVSVRLYRPGGDAVVASSGGATPVFERSTTPAFERRFVPGETEEIRVYLERGDDHVVVRGEAANSISVRVIGGEGDDVLTDSSRVEHGSKTHFYDASGDNTIVEGSDTRVATKPFVTPAPKRSLDEDEDKEPEENPRVLKEERRGRFRDLMPDPENFLTEQTEEGFRYWGESSGWKPLAGYRESAGVLLGIGPSYTDYGFRRRPYAWKAALRGVVGLRNGDLGVTLDANRYLENSRWSMGLLANASQFESNRFYGYGNDTERIDRDLSLVVRDEVMVQALLRYTFDSHSVLGFGPVVKYVDSDVPAGSPADLVAPLGTTEAFGQVGARAEYIFDETTVTSEWQSGFGANAGVSAYPAVWDADESFGEAHALARVFIPIGRPTLALRAGGQHCWGEFPLHESAFIGGKLSLRGFRWNRFVGDTSAYGSAELRVPLFRMTLLTRGRLGVLGFGDAARVWVDGESAGGWHATAGGGLWFGTLGQQVSVAYAHGDEDRVYAYYSLPF